MLPGVAGSSLMQVKEVGSGATQRQLREKLLEAARRREIDVVLVWRLDRWGRSVTDLLATLQELEHLGVGFVSLTEALDLTTPAGRAMAALLAVFAAFEREILGERVRAIRRAVLSAMIAGASSSQVVVRIPSCALRGDASPGPLIEISYPRVYEERILHGRMSGICWKGRQQLQTL